MAPAVDALSEDHAAVYDRQLRVWGVEVQRRLMEAKVLIIGLGGLAAEIAKNIVLAGVGMVALMDDTPATSAAPGNFLVEPGAATAGKSVAEASAATLQAMNPLMAVRVEPGPPHGAALLPGGGGAQREALLALLSRYDTLVATGLPLPQLAALDEACRQAGRQLFAGEVRGASSFVFADLGPRHVYSVKGQSEEAVLEYGSFRQAMAADLAAVNKRTHLLYLVLRACWEFEETHSRPPAGPADMAAVRSLFQRLLATVTASAQGQGRKGGVPKEAGIAEVLAPGGLLESFVLDNAAAAAAAAPAAAGAAEAADTAGVAEGAEAGGSQNGPAAMAEAEAGEQSEMMGGLAPVCAVVGGVVANNVLRAVSHVNPPLRNFFCYSLLARDGLGAEECFM